jgi:hypothetical protein
MPRQFETCEGAMEGLPSPWLFWNVFYQSTREHSAGTLVPMFTLVRTHE